MTEERFTEEELKRELKALKETGEETRQNYIRAHNERHALQQQNRQLIEALELYADDDFYNNLTDDVTANAKDVLQQIQGVEES